MKQLVEIICTDITTLTVDAVVNAANPGLLGGAGVDGAIHKAAGPELLEECRQLGGCKTGSAKISKAYRLPAKYIIHTVGPVWQGGTQAEDQLLASCYRSVLDLAAKHHLYSIAFPCISTGAYGYPFESACEVALTAIRDYLKESQFLFRKIYLVCYRQQDYELFKSVYEKFSAKGKFHL